MSDRVEFHHGEAELFAVEPSHFDVAACLGATWIADGVLGTIALLRQHLKPGGVLLIGEPYWISQPPEEVREALAAAGEFFTLAGLLDVFEAGVTQLVEMVLADGDSWERYVAAQWWTISEWLAEHPDDPQRAEARSFLGDGRRSYLEYERDYLGWGVFVLKVPD